MAGEDREESLSELLLDEEGQGEQRSEQGAGPPPEGSKDLPLYKELVSSGAILLYPLIFLEFTQFGVLYPILPSLQRDFFAQRHNGGVVLRCEDYSHANMPEACSLGNADAEFATGVVSAVSGLMTFFGSPLMGVLSDSMGRRPFVILSQASSLIPTALILLYSRGTISLWPYYIAQATSGFVHSIAILLAFVADTFSPANRAAGFGLVLAFFSFAILTTPLVGAFVPTQYIFTVAICVGIASTLYAVAFVPESLKPALRKPMSLDKLNPLKDVGILFRTRLFRRLTACVMIQSFAMQGTVTMLPYYLQDSLDFGKQEITALLVAFGVSGMLFNGVVLKQLTKIMSERRILTTGVAAGMMDKLVYAVVTKAWMVYANIMVFAGLSSITFSAISALKSNNVSDSEQGQVQGALFGAQSIAGAAGPLAFSALIKYLDTAHGTLPAFPQGVFLLAAVLEFAAFFVTLTIPESGKAEDLMTPRPLRGDDSDEDEPLASRQAPPLALDEVDAPPQLRRLRTFPVPASEDEGEATPP